MPKFVRKNLDLSLSKDAIRRIGALKDRHAEVAKAILDANADTYSEFFVEGGGIDFHEDFTDVITARNVDALRKANLVKGDLLLARPAGRTTIRRPSQAADGYSEFFVEGSGGGTDFHEDFTDVITGAALAKDPALRRKALAKLDVIQTLRKITAAALQG
ncbi:MAG: hypothetical protein KC486_05970 [Myxococcales bacterium]|nr:hypothetical protein [Myxococcales bacterium]